jgi:hypothetical protein
MRRPCHAHVAVRQCLGDKHRRGRGPLGAQSPGVLRHLEQGESELECLLEYVVRRDTGGVGLLGAGSKHVVGELAYDADDHFLVGGRSQVERAACSVGQASRGSGGLADEAAADGTDRAEAGLGGFEHHPLGWLAHAEAIDDARLGDPVEHGQRAPHQVAAIGRDAALRCSLG